jgi:hypothetical protein
MMRPSTEEMTRKQAIMAGIPYIITKQFPWKLHEMLDQVNKDGDDSIVSWLPDGGAFKVHQPDIFTEQIMKDHFNQTKYKSFQRQLNLWGFERNTKESIERGSYYHPLFIRGRKDLCQEMARQKIKNTDAKKKSFTSSGIAPPPELPDTTSSGGIAQAPKVTSQDASLVISGRVLPNPAAPNHSHPMFDAGVQRLTSMLQQPSRSSAVIDTLRVSRTKRNDAPLALPYPMMLSQQPLYVVNPLAHADAEILQALRKRAALETVLAASNPQAGASYMAPPGASFLYK